MGFWNSRVDEIKAANEQVNEAQRNGDRAALASAKAKRNDAYSRATQDERTEYKQWAAKEANKGFITRLLT